MCLDSFASRARLQKTKLLQKATIESAFEENVRLDDRFCSLGRYARGEEEEVVLVSLVIASSLPLSPCRKLERVP